MRLSKDEVQVIRSIEQLQSSAVAMSPGLYREWCRVSKLKEEYQYREGSDGKLHVSICLDKYPPSKTYMKRGNVK